MGNIKLLWVDDQRAIVYTTDLSFVYRSKNHPPMGRYRWYLGQPLLYESRRKKGSDATITY